MQPSSLCSASKKKIRNIGKVGKPSHFNIDYLVSGGASDSIVQDILFLLFFEIKISRLQQLFLTSSHVYLSSKPGMMKCVLEAV